MIIYILYTYTYICIYMYNLKSPQVNIFTSVYIYIGVLIVIGIVQVFFRKLCYWDCHEHSLPVIGRRHNILADFLVIWFLQSVFFSLILRYRRYVVSTGVQNPMICFFDQL